MNKKVEALAKVLAEVISIRKQLELAGLNWCNIHAVEDRLERLEDKIIKELKKP